MESIIFIEHPLCGKRWLFGFCRHHIIGWTLWLQSWKQGHWEFGLLGATQPRRLEPALEPLSLSDSYVTEMRRLAHSLDRVRKQLHNHNELCGPWSLLLSRSAEKRSILIIRFSPLLSTKNVRAMSGNESSLTFRGEYMYSTQARNLAAGIYDRLHSLAADLWCLSGVPVPGMC